MIPTAEDVMIPYDLFDNEDKEMIKLAMIEFAKIHVEAALKAASNEWLMSEVDKHGNLTEQSERYNTKAILNAYPLENIK